MANTLTLISLVLGAILTLPWAISAHRAADRATQALVDAMARALRY